MHHQRFSAVGGVEFKTEAEQASFAFVEHLAGDGDSGGEAEAEGEADAEAGAEAEADGVGEVAVDAVTELKPSLTRNQAQLVRSVRPAFKAKLTGIDRAQVLLVFKKPRKKETQGLILSKG